MTELTPGIKQSLILIGQGYDHVGIAEVTHTMPYNANSLLSGRRLNLYEDGDTFGKSKEMARVLRALDEKLIDPDEIVGNFDWKRFESLSWEEIQFLDTALAAASVERQVMFTEHGLTSSTKQHAMRELMDGIQQKMLPGEHRTLIGVVVAYYIGLFITKDITRTSGGLMVIPRIPE